MANEQHLAILKEGVDAWNRWRKENRDTKSSLRRVNLSEADLRGADLSMALLYRANLRKADLSEADLFGAHLYRANLSEANLSGANLYGTYLSGANLSGANLSEADLSRANLYGTYLSGADLGGAKLAEANLTATALVETNLQRADLTGCSVYGVPAWNLDLTETIQSNLVVTRKDEAIITVDNLEVAQFIYLMLNNEKIRDIIYTITTKVVLILGRFIPERKAVLDAIREELRNHDLLPVLFDFEGPTTRDLHETVTTLARMARFVIADITDPNSIPQELVSVVEQLPSLPVQPILQDGHEPWGMYEHIKRYPWVLTTHRYRDLDDLLASLEGKVIDPAEAKAKESEQR